MPEIARRVKRRAHAVFRALLPEPGLALVWIRRDPKSWLSKTLPEKSIKIPTNALADSFEHVARELNKRGKLPLWDGYRDAYSKNKDMPWATRSMEREPDQVRTQPHVGRFFTWLASKRRPDVAVEIGTAFGVSAMYWAAGLNNSGCLLTFEPNQIWHEIAASHLGTFGRTVIPILGTFETQIDKNLKGRRIALAFVDGIHSQPFVDAQLAMLKERMTRNGIIVLDDIDFSDDMKRGWDRWANDRDFISSVSVDKRVGILELG